MHWICLDIVCIFTLPFDQSIVMLSISSQYVQELEKGLSSSRNSLLGKGYKMKQTMNITPPPPPHPTPRMVDILIDRNKTNGKLS